MNEKLIQGYAHFTTPQELSASAAHSAAVSPSTATPISGLSVASFLSGVLTYRNAC